MTSLTVHVPAKINAPRGAWLAAAVFARLLQALHISKTVRSGQRQRRQLENDAARVRRFAQQMMAFDPRFASDLFAAADRAERADSAGR